MGVWNARLLDDSLHKALYGRGKALYQSTHHYKDFGLLGPSRMVRTIYKQLSPEEVHRSNGPGGGSTPGAPFPMGRDAGERHALHPGLHRSPSIPPP